MAERRTVFFVSDGTGITVEMLGHSLLTQFEGIEFDQVTIPFVDSPEKAADCRARIEGEIAKGDNGSPIVFSTLVDHALRQAVRTPHAVCLDFFERFIDPLEASLGLKSTHTVGRSHTVRNVKEYQRRIEAINFTMAHDDAASHAELDQAELILVGVSRSGKTPTCLYLAMQFGIKTANYPLIPEDLQVMELPVAIRDKKQLLYGLTISPERLAEIRHARRPESRYADPENCRQEVSQAERLMRREGIRWIDSTTRSIEEIATTILREKKMERHIY